MISASKIIFLGFYRENDRILHSVIQSKQKFAKIEKYIYLRNGPECQKSVEFLNCFFVFSIDLTSIYDFSKSHIHLLYHNTFPKISLNLFNLI